ncbi:hypothetical protein SDC9_186279 [bioreactor metagenome]|uniref:Uncharacterized protein n=1 Tax=bioreactor metagenome TaxID=1076179 RepID=A0A645HRI0_9ZZZZ
MELIEQGGDNIMVKNMTNPDVDFSFISRMSTLELKRALRNMKNSQPLDDMQTHLATIEILETEIFLREALTRDMSNRN